MYGRILDKDLPLNKKFFIMLTYLFGIGKSFSLDIFKKLNINQTIQLNENLFEKIKKYLESRYIIENSLRRKLNNFRKHITQIKSYKGLRYIYGLPVRGQRTRANAQTVKKFAEIAKEQKKKDNKLNLSQQKPWIKN